MDDLQDSEAQVSAQMKEAPVVEKPVKVDKTFNVEEANKAADRLEAANLQAAELIRQAQHDKVQAVLDGSASAGETKLSDEEKAEQAAKDYIASTGLGY